MLIIDLLSYFICVFISILFYSIPINETILNINWLLILCGAIFFIVSIKNYKGYKNYEYFSQLNQISSLLKASILTNVSAISALFIFQIKIPYFLTFSSKIAFIISLIVIPILLRQLFNQFFKNKLNKENILIFGAGEIGLSFAEILKITSITRFKLIGFIDDAHVQNSIVNGLSILGKTEDLENICEANNIKRLIIASRHINEEKLLLLEQKAFELNIKISYLPSIESFKANPFKLKEFSGIPLITKNTQTQSMFYSLGKRSIDIIISILGFILSSPLWLIVSIIIKNDSNGPIFFTQERIGLNGNKFKIYKFRSMNVTSPKYADCPVDKNDLRVTRIGKWLRKTSIDELPQLINILKGEMSLVGPRPEMPFIVEKYNLVEKKRLIVKPGLTGLWQVSPYRNSQINHNLEYDFYYIQNQGFVLDIVILFMTLFFVFRGIAH